MESIRDIAQRFRAAIEISEVAKRPIGIKEFPMGACGDASRLIGTYLQENGFGEFTYICAGRSRIEDNAWITHAWI